MVTYSKLLQEVMTTQKCRGLAHQGSCVHNAIVNIFYFFLSNMRYFAPITLLPLLLKLRQLNRSMLLKTLKYYAECTLIGTISGWSIKVLICIFYHLMGGFREWTFLYVPCIVGCGSSLLLAPPRVRVLYVVTTLQSMIESQIMKRSHWLTKTVANSLICQTWIFMCCSAIILHAKSIGVYRGFWLLTPKLKKLQQQNTNNNSNDTTVTTETKKELGGVEYVLVGMRNYLAIGLTLDIIKMMMSKISKHDGAATRGIRSALLAKLSNFRVNSTALLTCYVGIYRLLDHYGKYYLMQYGVLNDYLPGFFAGASYAFLPKLTLLSYSIVQCISILWRYYELRPLTPDVQDNKRRMHIRNLINKLQRVLKYHIPYSLIFYAFGIGYLVHNYCFNKSIIGSMARKVINGLTDNYALNITIKVDEIARRLEATK